MTVRIRNKRKGVQIITSRSVTLYHDKNVYSYGEVAGTVSSAVLSYVSYKMRPDFRIL